MQKVPEDAGKLQAFEAQVSANPHLAGVYLHVGWKEIEQEAGKPDFSRIDNAVAVLRRVGLKYSLGLKPGIDTPPFVFREGARAFETKINNPRRANFGSTVAIPIPWDPIYQQHFSRVIQQLGKRYADDPLCVGVVLTCANFMSAEMHLPKTPEDRAKWKAMGDYGTKLLEVYKKYTDEWARAFPKQAISLSLSQVVDLPSSFFENIIDYGVSKYPERFTIQSDQLSGRKEDTGTMSYDLVLKYRDRLHHGFQSVAGFSHGGQRMGSIEMAVLNVIHAQGEFWELWNDDGMNGETSASVDKAWQEGKQLGYDAYKKKLIAENSYIAGGQDGYRGQRRGSRQMRPMD